ncbi:MAG: M20/M25/M40 family metallo-hydrolase [Candidatus Hodarchaeota archaeon]
MDNELQSIMDSILTYGEELLRIPGISGHEDEVASYFTSKLSGYGSISRDPIGNCVLRIGNQQSNFKILVTAHMDSVGFIAKRINDDLEADLLPVGINQLNTYRNCCLAAIGEKKTVKGTLQIENNSFPKFLVEKDEATLPEAAVDVGDQVVAFKPAEISKNAKILKGCWLDNRMGLSVLINLAKSIPQEFPADICILASVREEIGAKGAGAVLREFHPDFAIVIDATWTQASVLKGHGPVLTVWDPCVVVKPKDRRLITKLAAKLSIPLQKEAVGQGSSDAGPFTQAGIPTFCLMYPVEGLHTPSEEVALKDAAWNLMLVRSLLDVLKSQDKNG